MTRIEEPGQHVAEMLKIFEERAEKYFPGASHAAVYSHTQQKMVIVPIHEAIGSQFSHAIDYGSGVFEGGSALMNERTGVPHVILMAARNRRLFERSLPSRDYQSPVSREEFGQTMLELIDLQGESLFKHPDGKTRGWVRAYVRPNMHPAPLAGYGVSLRKGYPIDAGIIVWAWPDYLDPTLAKRGGTAAITGHQRNFEITGKNSSNYGAAVKDGNLARDLGADELIYLAPYYVNESGQRYFADNKDLDTKLKDGVISDGPGEECIALDSDQRTLIYTPMSTNRLGGTTLQYIIDHLATNVGLKTKEADITLHDLRDGKYAGLAMVGNAVKVTPMRQVQLYKDKKVVETIELFTGGNVPEKLRQLAERWDHETRGLVDPSHPSLITPVK